MSGSEAHGANVARPTKPLEQHVREGTFRARRHAGLLAGPELEQWPACAALQRQYRETKDAGDRSAIALEFERAVSHAHSTVGRAATPAPERHGRAEAPDRRAPIASSAPAQNRVVPRLALSPNEAAETLGVSRDFFDEHIASELRIVRRGRRKLIAFPELERWLSEQAAFALERTA
jgi:excisionase family DNA binding protein